MPDKNPAFTLMLDAPSDADIESLSRELQRALAEAPEITTVQPMEKIAPPEQGIKSAAVAIDWNTLLITLAASGGVLTTLIAAIQAWIVNRQQTSVTLTCGEYELEISGTGPYTKEQQMAIELWMSRCRGIILPQ